MKRAIAFIEECNQLRTTDNNFPDCEPLVVNDAVMAVAQLNANWATYTNGSYHSHAAVFNTNENLAWYYLDRPGSDDPFEGWYDQEKAIYDSKGSGVTGHYLNITNKDLSATGFGVNLSKDSNCAARIFTGLEVRNTCLPFQPDLTSVSFRTQMGGMVLCT